MKQFLKRTIAGAACLTMALLFAESASAKGDIFTQRQILVDEDCICGVIFLGYVNGENTLQAMRNTACRYLRTADIRRSLSF